MTNKLVRILICGTVLGLATAVVHSQSGEWRSYSGDPGSRKYSRSTLSRIKAGE